MVFPHPIRTVGAPRTAEAPHTEASPTLRAGLPPINTVALPVGKGPTVGWCPVGGSAQTWRSAATAAGIPPIRTVGMPGPEMTPP